jgi:hypothetical protein
MKLEDSTDSILQKCSPLSGDLHDGRPMIQNKCRTQQMKIWNASVEAVLSGKTVYMPQ